MNFRNFWASIDKINFILILILGLLGVLLSYSVNPNFLIINRHSIFYISSLFIIIFFVEPYIDFNITFALAMTHQVILVSFGAFTILMFLIKHNSASKTVSIFFLIPATSAFIAWLFLNENLNYIDIFGFIIASAGVFIATRK